MRILVTEDEPRILSFLARGLEAEGFSVDSAADGAEALRCVGGARYDLVVLDLLLPKLDGLAVLQELQRQRPELPVVIVSARSDLQTKLPSIAGWNQVYYLVNLEGELDKLDVLLNMKNPKVFMIGKRLL